MVDIIDPREHNIVTLKGYIKNKVVHSIKFTPDKKMEGKILFNGVDVDVYQRRSLWHLKEN